MGLLTADEYRKNRDILPPLGEGNWWWLCTSHSVNSGYVLCVAIDGSLHDEYVSQEEIGVRPTLWLRNDAVVEVEE